MSRLILADTGPLVALFNKSDAAHRWAVSRFQEFTEPLATCEAVLTEALHLLRKIPPAHFDLLTLWERELLRIELSAQSERMPSADCCIDSGVFRFHSRTLALFECRNCIRNVRFGRWTTIFACIGAAGASRSRS
jgi:hypothetical protein